MEGAVRGETSQNHRITRRGMLQVRSAALAGVAALAVQTIGRLSDRPIIT